MKTEKTDFLFLLRTLAEHDVDFIVVGGVCAVLHGAPVSTFDLDVVHSRTPENIDRLLKALEKLDAYFRGQGTRRIKPNKLHLSSPGHQLLATVGGPLDLLGTIGKGRGYEELLHQTVEFQVGGNVKIRLLRLETLLEIKMETARDKDIAALPVIRRTIEEKNRK